MNKTQKIVIAIIFTIISLSGIQVSAADSPATVGKKGGEGSKSREDTCRSFKDDEKKLESCESAWNKARGTKKGKQLGESAASSGSKRSPDESSLCGDSDKPSASYYCRVAYKSALVTAAKKKGSDTGKADKNDDNKSAEDACNGINFGDSSIRSKLKNECEKSYRYARKVAEGGKATENNCGDVSTYFNYEGLCNDANKDEGGEKNPIYAIIITVVNWLAGLVGVAVVGGILYGGFLYTAARDNAGQTQKAITIIVDAIIGLILYAMLYTIINFLVPGGLFSS